jgi:putative FmdB family regulatory protein
MPVYEYRCENGHTFEVTQRMSDDALETCQVCGAPVQRVFHPVAVHFKGSGFYNTDYGTRKRAREKSESADGSGSSSDSKSTSDSKSSSDTKLPSDSKSGSGTDQSKASAA